MEQKRLKFGWGIPAYKRGVDIGVVHMAMLMGGLPYIREDVDFLGVIDTDSCSVPNSRNQMLYLTMMNGGDWLVMSDADTYTHGVEHIPDMIVKGQELGAAAIGMPCLMRNGQGYNIKIDVKQDWGWNYEPGTIQEVERIGSGLLAVNLNWIKESWPMSPWFREVHVPGPKPLRIGSDIVFCDDLRQRGGKVYSYGLHEPVHVGVGNTGHAEIDKKEAQRQAECSTSAAA